jgi:hypothetical protein
LAVTVATACALTDDVVAGKVPEVFPAATKTEAGTCTALLSLPKLTTNPPGGAAPVRVTVPVDEFPPVTIAGLKLNPLTPTPCSPVPVTDRFTVPAFEAMTITPGAVPATVGTNITCACPLKPAPRLNGLPLDTVYGPL